MDKTKYVIKIDNKRIYDFYKENPNINIETMNLILLDFINQIGNDMSKVMSNTLFGEILNNVKDIKLQVNSLNDNFKNKLHENNKEFLDNIKLVISLSSSENTDKIIQLLNKNTESFIDKINISIPKTQEETYNKIQDKLYTFQNSINDEIKTFLSSSSSETNIKDFISTIDSKISSMQQPIFTFISSNQEHLSNKLENIKDETISNKTINDKLISELGDFLNKYKSSSQFKGQCSENMIESILNKMYPTAEIINSTALKASGDFIIKREERPNIMIENKNYEANVNIDEIKKFLRDVNEQKTHAIMMSQLSGIVSKPNGFIELNDGKVLIYLHYVDYSPDKIKMAIDIIDNLSDKLQDISSMEKNEGYSITKDSLERINDEYQKFLNHKESIQLTLKDLNKKLTSQLEAMKLPNLSLYLNDKFASIQNQQFICDICNLPFPHKKSLASHKKIHNKDKKDNKINNLYQSIEIKDQKEIILEIDT